MSIPKKYAGTIPTLVIDPAKRPDKSGTSNMGTPERSKISCMVPFEERPRILYPFLRKMPIVELTSRVSPPREIGITIELLGSV